MYKISVQLIANSGLWLEFANQHFLIDGIYGATPYFSPPQKEMQKAVFGMESCYRNADKIFFTHRHVDHFSSKYLNEYLKNNQVESVFVPAISNNPDPFEDRGQVFGTGAAERLHEIKLDYGETQTYSLGLKCSAQFIRTKHLDAQNYSEICHCMLHLTLGEVSMLFAADSLDAEENFQALLNKKAASSGIRNAPLLGKFNWQKHIS
jgi:ribonuclease BN (tRNA processing enzyme)